MDIFLAVVGTLLILTNLFCLYMAIQSRSVHTNSYQVSVALADYINKKASEMNEMSQEQAQAEIEKTMAEARLLDAQAEMISGDVQQKQGIGLAND